MNQNQPKDYFDSIIGSTNQVTGSTTSTTQPKDYFDSIVGSTNNAVADTTSSTNQPMDYFDTILANQKNTQKDVTGLGTKQAEDFNAQLANFKNANPVLKYKTFEKYRDQYQSYLTQRGYSTGQIDKLLAEFNEKADPRNQTSNFEYYVGDRFNDVMIGGGNLIGDALAAVPETLPIVGEWADKWEKEYKNAVRDWQSDLSAKNQIQKYLGDKAEEEALKNGANEFTATLANVKANPMQITSLLTQQTPQLLLGGAGTKALGAINAAGGMGRERSDIEEAYERTLKENPQQLLTLPEIQSRMAKGMTLEEAVNDAKTDYSDNLGHILMGGVIGASEALTPTGRFMRGVNRGVAGTLAKEVGQEAFQEGAEKLNSNDAVGYIDGKTQLTDGVIKNATLGGIAGFGTGIPTAIEAGLNRNRPTDDQPLEDQIAQNSQPQSEQMAQPQPTTEVNGQAVDNVLNARQFESEEARKEYENELKSAIKEGSIQEAAKANTAFGQLARDYLAQTGQTVEPTPQVKPENSVINPEIERVLSLRDRMLKWREGGKLGDISDLLPTMMTFSDAEAKRDFAMKQAFSEVKSVAQKYGIDPNDGKAMFAWLNDYVTQRDNAQIQAKQTREDNYRQQYDTFLTGKAPQQAVGNSENSANPISDMTQAEQQLQQTANIAPSQDRNVVIGGTDTVDIGENNYQPFQYEVMEATDLAPTQQKAGNQLRDRDRASSQAQVTKIARNLDPRKLGESPTMEMGAPLLAQDGQTVIAGNGRSMAIRQAYQEGKGNGYRQFLQENATKFGLDPNQVAEMQNPVLIRRLNTAVDIKQTAINSNEQGGMRMSNLEQAKVDAGRLPNMAGFELGENGELNTVGNQGFISQFIQNQPETLRNELLDSKGNLSQTGVQRLRNAMLYNAYGDTDILARAVESTDQGARNIITALTRLAPTVAKVKQDMANGTLSDVDISNDIVSAVEKYNQLKSQNHNVDEYLQQQDFVSELSPEAKAVLRIFNENARSAKRISDVLGSYYRSAEIQGNTAQASMFGEETFDKAGALEQAKNADLEERHSRSPIKSVEANIKRGREAMHTAIVERRTVHRAMFNHNLDGWVDFEWGDIGRTLPNGKTKGAMGIAHIIESRMRKDNMNYMQATKMLIERVVDTLAKGQVSRIYESGKVKSVFIDYNGNRATLIKREGSNSWLMNAFELKPTDEQVGSNDPNLPTQTLPTRQRQGVGAVGSYNVQQSAPQSNPQIAQDQATLSRILGEDVARHIEVVDRNSQVPSGKNIKKLVTQGVEGWFESGSQKLYLISDNIEANSTFSRDERLAWVAWHELAHKGVRIKFGKILTNLLNSAGKHPTVKAIAQRIQVEYKRDNIDLSHEAAVEEAMMELFSAKETGNWQALADRYQVQIPLMVQRGSQLGKYFAQFANHFRRLIRTVLKRDIAMSDREVFETLQGIKQGIDQFAKNPQNPTPSKGDSEARYSLNERADSEFANAVPKRTASSFDEARAIVSELLGEPLTNKATGMVATISKRSLDKLVSGKAHSKSSSLEDHLTAVANIDQLFENAELGWIEPHKSDTVNIAGMHKLFAPLLLNGEMKLAKLTVKEMNFNQGNKIYSVETIEVENGKGTVPEMTEVLTGNSNIAPHRLHSASMQSLIQRIADFNSQSENSANDEQDTRYSRKQSIENLTKTGKAEKNDKTLGDWFKALPSNINTALEDSLRPVVNWVKSLETVEPHIQEQILGEMYRAAGLKDNYRMDLEQRFVKPIIKDLAELGKKYKKLDNLSIKRLVGIYASLKWSIRKNELLLKADAEKMNEAKQALDEALQNGSQAEIDKADIAYRRAKRTYEDRQKDVKNTQFGEAYADVPFLVGTAGGWSIPEARAYMANIEQHIAKADIEKVLNKLYDLQQAMLDIDAVSQRYTPEQLAEYRKEPLYVPLTGDNDINAKENAFIGGAGRTAVNIASDKALKGRKLSEAEDAFDAVMKAIGKTTTYASWQPFKQILSDVYETEVQREIGKGKTMSEAKQIAEDRLGISKSRLQGITRPSDGKLIFKESGIAYEMGLPEGIMEVLKEETVERPLNALRFPSYLTRLMAQGVTQLTYDFPFVNMLRDTMDKADMIKDRTIYDQNGNPLSQEAKNKIGNQIYLHAFNPAIGKATGRFAFGKALGNSKYEKNLKRLAELGGLSTFTSELARTEKDFVKLVKKEGSASAAAGRLLKNIVVGWSGSFDFISATATFTSLIENGVDEKQAAALTLDLANFRKTGKMTRSVKGLFMFMQAKMMGAAQLIRDTEKS